MKIWKLERDRIFETLIYKDEGTGYGRIKPAQNGKPRSLLETWDALEVEFLFEIDVSPRPFRQDSDFPRLIGIQAWSKKAIDILKPLIADQVEFLPLKAVMVNIGSSMS